jgi:undecaprenyl-diphosphatase
MHFFLTLDHDTARVFHSLREAHPRLTDPMRDISSLGDWTVLSLVVIFAVGLLLCLRRYRTAGFVLASALGGVLISIALKILIDRARPADAIVPVSGPSFPSGHSMLSAIIYLTLAWITSAVIPRWRVRSYIIGFSLFLAGLVGISRLYLGVHYLTDVLAGWTVGLAWALLCRRIEFHWVVRLERRAALANANDDS